MRSFGRVVIDSSESIHLEIDESRRQPEAILCGGLKDRVHVLNDRIELDFNPLSG